MAEKDDASAKEGIGALLRYGRERAGLSQEEVAKAARVSRVTLGKYEDGYVIKVAELYRIAEVLGTKLGVNVFKHIPGAMDLDAAAAKALLDSLLENRAAAPEEKAEPTSDSPPHLTMPGLAARLRSTRDALRTLVTAREATRDVLALELLRGLTGVATAVREESTKEAVRIALEAMQPVGGEEFEGALVTLLHHFVPLEAIGALLAVSAMKVDDRRRALGALILDGVENERFIAWAYLARDRESDADK